MRKDPRYTQFVSLIRVLVQGWHAASTRRRSSSWIKAEGDVSTSSSAHPRPAERPLYRVEGPHRMHLPLKWPTSWRQRAPPAPPRGRRCPTTTISRSCSTSTRVRCLMQHRATEPFEKITSVAWWALWPVHSYFQRSTPFFKPGRRASPSTSRRMATCGTAQAVGRPWRRV